jgi:hypothetical protein
MMLVQVTGQKVDSKTLYDKIVKLSAETGVNVLSVSASKMKDYDLGHDGTVAIREPKVAIFAGQGFNNAECGSIWLLLNYRLKTKPTILESSSLARANLNEYNVIIIPSGRALTLGSAVNKLGDWVRAGGTLIATGAAWRVINDLKITELKEKKLFRGDSATYIPYGDRADRAAMFDIPGSHLRVRIDTTHPLAWGYTQPTMAVIKATTLAFEKPKEANLVPVVYDKNPQISGFLRKEHSKALEDTPAVVCGPAGSGAYIYIVDDLTFRSYWYGGMRMFTNAVFFGNLIK